MDSTLRVCVRTFLILVNQILPELALTVLTALNLTGLSCGKLSADANSAVSFVPSTYFPISMNPFCASIVSPLAD